MNKFFFLYKSETTLNIIFIFLICKIKNIFYKKEIISLKRKHQSFILNKKITNDYFSSHAFNFLLFLKKLKENFKYLEIGSYEGNSAIFVANHFEDSEIYCIDNWNKTEEYINHKDFSEIEKNFDFNVNNYPNIKKIKMSSDSFFENNSKQFDVIYVDGYHYGPQVQKDCENAWKFLKKNGYLICDDYIWNFYKKIKENPCFAINQFLLKIKGSFKIEKVSNSQIFIKKISE
tara:strand:+ start:1736 stop:2431 length:696 start_codon:yes stop_codon:yes gene_type:complete